MWFGFLTVQKVGSEKGHSRDPGEIFARLSLGSSESHFYSILLSSKSLRPPQFHGGRDWVLFLEVRCSMSKKELAPLIFGVYLSSSLVAQMVKNLPAMKETWVQSLGQEDTLEKGMATHYSILAWRIPWTEKPGGLQSMGSQIVRHNWATNTFTSFIQSYMIPGHLRSSSILNLWWIKRWYSLFLISHWQGIDSTHCF